MALDTARQGGLPRTRGDRPSVIETCSALMSAPPHTRGSTRAVTEDEVRQAGSPAHAGIDRGVVPHAERGAGLPRTRGDRPFQTFCGDLTDAAPPHTRGSTLRNQLNEISDVGSPAHAGIDPRSGCAHAGEARLPRTRGDRPAERLMADPEFLAPPHTRGSTPTMTISTATEGGSPAHAGIDPEGDRVHHVGLGLPRTRGDRPAHGASATISTLAPPHTRGSTRRVGAGVHVGGGSPAHAGIDPSAPRAATSCRRLPRTRGDRPDGQGVARPQLRAPPHTRGSTPCCAFGRRVGSGSPAHAGIDPAIDRLEQRTLGLPRTRGDRPVVPALRDVDRGAPPHTRGSTCEAHAPVRERRGSPAHAGIDRACLRRWTQ